MMSVPAPWLKLGGGLAAAVSVALLIVAVAASAPGDPKRLLKPADQARARSLVLRKADLLAGVWKASATDFSQPNPKCVLQHYRLDSLTETGLAGFDYLNSAAFLEVESAGSIFLTSAQARRAFATYSQAGFSRCFADSVAAGLPSNLTAKVVKQERVRRATPGVAFGGFRVVFSVRQGANSNGPLEVYFIFLQRGRALSDVVIVRGGASVPASLRDALIDRAAFKLRRL
jgi:hypothetical protein